MASLYQTQNFYTKLLSMEQNKTIKYTMHTFILFFFGSSSWLDLFSFDSLSHKLLRSSECRGLSLEACREHAPTRERRVLFGHQDITSSIFMQEASFIGAGIWVDCRVWVMVWQALRSLTSGQAMFECV